MNPQSLKEVEAFWKKVCFDPDYQPAGRFKVYRELVNDGLLDVLQTICPVANEILTEQEWKMLLREFIINAPPKSTILRDLPFEVAQYLKAHEHLLLDQYPYLGELIEYEFSEVAVAHAIEDKEMTSVGKIRINPAHCLQHYRWPVHFISAQNSDYKQLPLGDYYLLLWRDPTSLKIRFMEVSLLVASVLELLKRQALSAEELFKKVAKVNRVNNFQELFVQGEALLRELKGKGILLF